MARRAIAVSLALVLVGMLWAQASAQSGCTTAIVSLAPCLNYISGNSSAPTSTCCSQLASVVQSQAQCLCMVLTGGASSFGLNINQTQALALPGACKVQTPPISQCKATTAGPVASPAASPKEKPSAPPTPSTPSTPGSSAPTSPETPAEVPSIPSGTGSKTVPTTGDSSDGSSNKSTRSMTLSFLVLVACLSMLATH